MNKKQKPEIKNLHVQLLKNAHPKLQETIAYYECDGDHYQIPFFIKRVKNAPASYYINETKNEFYKLKNIKKPYKRRSGLSLKRAILIASLTAVCGAGISVGTIYTVKAIKANNANVNKIEVTFDAGIGQFNDGSRIKTVAVNAGTKLSQIPHDTASFISDIERNSEGVITGYEFQSTKGWLTDSGNYISEGESADIAFNNNICLFADFSVDLTAAKSIAIGKMANKAAEAIARQPEAEEKIRNMLDVAYEQLDISKDGYEMMAIGEATACGAEAIARQPEAEGKINAALLFGDIQLRRMKNDGRAVGLGIMLGKGVEAIARQPEADGKINNAMKLAYDYVSKAESAMDGYACGILTASACEGIARQPEAEGKITGTMKTAFEYLDYSDDTYESFAIGEATASAVASIARQPEAEGKIHKALITGFTAFHAQPNDGRVEGVGETTAMACESIARQPEAEGKINSAAELVYNSLSNVANPMQGQAIGHAGASACEGIARQPEAEGKILATLYIAIQKILNS